MKATATGLLVAAAVVFVVTRTVEDDAPGWAPSGPPPRPRWSARWPTGSRSPRCSGARSACPSPTPRSSRPTRTGSAAASARSSSRTSWRPDLLAQRVRDARVAQRAGVWLAEPSNAHRAGGTVAQVLAGVADVLDDREASAAIEQAVLARFQATEAAPVLARALELALDEGHHRVVIDSVLRSAGEYLDEHREVLRDRLRSDRPGGCPSPSTTGSTRRSSAAPSASSATCGPTRITSCAKASTSGYAGSWNGSGPTRSWPSGSKSARTPCWPSRPCRAGWRRCGAS